MEVISSILAQPPPCEKTDIFVYGSVADYEAALRSLGLAGDLPSRGVANLTACRIDIPYVPRIRADRRGGPGKTETYLIGGLFQLFTTKYWSSAPVLPGWAPEAIGYWAVETVLTQDHQIPLSDIPAACQPLADAFDYQRSGLLGRVADLWSVAAAIPVASINTATLGEAYSLVRLLDAPEHRAQWREWLRARSGPGAGQRTSDFQMLVERHLGRSEQLDAAVRAEIANAVCDWSAVGSDVRLDGKELIVESLSGETGSAVWVHSNMEAGDRVEVSVDTLMRQSTDVGFLLSSSPAGIAFEFVLGETFLKVSEVPANVVRRFEIDPKYCSPGEHRISVELTKNSIRAKLDELLITDYPAAGDQSWHWGLRVVGEQATFHSPKIVHTGTR